MKTNFIFTCALLIIPAFIFAQNQTIEKDIVTVDYTMAERAIDWLKFINTGADTESIKQHFMKKVAQTKGCQAIIHHWARFKKWDENVFFKFTMEALDKIPSDKPLKNEDGSLTGFGERRALWLSALSDPEKLIKDIKDLKKLNLRDTALTMAKKYLPDDANISNNFFIVLFGASAAFSVGKENGFDLLQLPKTSDGSIDVERIIRIFAHEMHHSGFNYCYNKYMTEVNNEENIILIGILAAEGMPTYFINKTKDNLEKYKTSQNVFDQDLAQDWEKHLARLPELYIEAEKDISLNLSGKLGQNEIFEKWMGGIQGPAYVLGSDMFSVIEKNLGLDAAKPVAHDFRQFLVIYNQAAKKANKEGNHCFIFNEELVNKVENYTGK